MKSGMNGAQKFNIPNSLINSFKDLGKLAANRFFTHFLPRLSLSSISEKPSRFTE